MRCTDTKLFLLDVLDDSIGTWKFDLFSAPRITANHCLTRWLVSLIKERPRESSLPYSPADGGPSLNPTPRDFLKLTTIDGPSAPAFAFTFKPAFPQLPSLR